MWQDFQKLFFVVMLFFNLPFSPAQENRSGKGTKAYYLSVARLSVIQKGNDFFAKYRVSVNNNSKDTLYYDDSNCGKDLYNISISEIKIDASDCKENIKRVCKISPGNKKSRELLLTGKTREVASNPAFRIFFSFQQKDRNGQVISKQILRTPELHLTGS